MNSLRRALAGPLFGIEDLGLGEILLATFLAVFAAVLAFHPGNGDPVTGIGGALAVQLMIWPILFARRYPLPTAAALFLATVFNWVVIGQQVRCGPALPAVFFVSLVVGTRCPLRTGAMAEGLLCGAICVQCVSDPQLQSIATALLMIPISLGFLGIGLLLRRRRATVEALRMQTAALRDQREANAKLAVEADRERIAGDLDGFLHEQVSEIATHADLGRLAIESGPEAAQREFNEIGETGRRTLTRMREVVRSLEEAPTEPQPVLAQLDHLIAQAQFADLTLSVHGDPHRLPPGLELSAYRVVEHLLVTLSGNDAASKVEVTFGASSLELAISGPSAPGASVRNALEAAKERVALHGGSVSSSNRNGRRETLVVLPLAFGSL